MIEQSPVKYDNKTLSKTRLMKVAPKWFEKSLPIRAACPTCTQSVDAQNPSRQASNIIRHNP